MNDLPDVDPAAVAGFWARAIAAGALPPDAAPPTYQGPFGDSVEQADRLLDLVLHGPKRATAGSVAMYEALGEPIAVPGDRWVATDGAGRPRALLQTTDVRVGPLSSVDDAFAWDEGEGDRTRADWLRGHTAYFTREAERLGYEVGPDLPVVFERFAVVYVE